MTTLTYWNGRGLCEMIRIMLAACQEEYTECVPGVEGASHITEKQHFQHMKDEGMLKFDQCPLLCIDGLRLVQSRAIVRYLANKHHLAGSNPAEQVQCDMFAEAVQDWLSAIGRAFEFNFGAYEPNPEQLEKFAAGNDKWLPRFEKYASKSETGWIMEHAGIKNMTYVDVTMLEGLEMAATRDPSVFDKYPGIKRLHEKLRAEKWVQSFLESDRRKTKTQDVVAGYVATVRGTL
eukprot:TRINITY_DN40290_c0_g1_i1.p1 TRINITY_DN40290_c0_g1~~TRINITY_DN40290_c0_g1_i1.p1  ORF type:complete len:234 (+),score=93.58 TRINITY_DN40290_c0_g1_i1:67-768(+)